MGDISKIEYRSSWEYKLMHWLDMNDHVAKWGSETVVIPYYSNADCKNRRYFMDFVVHYIDGSKFLYEVKPEKETKPPRKVGRKKESVYLAECYTFSVNKDKWIHAIQYAKSNGYIFKILTEHNMKSHFGINLI